MIASRAPATEPRGLPSALLRTVTSSWAMSTKDWPSTSMRGLRRSTKAPDAAGSSGATSSVDQVIAQVLATLGVQVGQATVWVSSVRCDGAVLVN